MREDYGSVKACPACRAGGNPENWRDRPVRFEKGRQTCATAATSYGVSRSARGIFLVSMEDAELRFRVVRLRAIRWTESHDRDGNESEAG